MPIFEFQCDKCKKIIEKIVQSNSANEEEFTVDEPCECGNNTFNKIMSSSSFHLKGSGWAASGYQKKED